MKSFARKAFAFLKKEAMLTVSLAAAVVSLIITPPSPALLTAIDWRTLGTLLMMLCVLEGFKKENIFLPVIRLAGRLNTLFGLSLFLVFGVFFSSMFVTNDVSLIVFVPLTIYLFRRCGRERYILPIITLENIAAVRGSLLTPFGSPQNLFLYGKCGKSVWEFMLHMLPLNLLSGGLLLLFILVIVRKDREPLELCAESETADPARRRIRVGYLILFALIVWTIVSRTGYWWISLAAVIAAVVILDRRLFLQVDYVLLVTFLCFFVFSSSITANPVISAFLQKAVAGREYWWGIGLSQIISNVPAAIVLYPFTENLQSLLYGVDTAGLCSLIGSLASVINYRLYVREYPGNGKKFIGTFTGISWIFFAFVVIPGWLLCRWPL